MHPEIIRTVTAQRIQEMVADANAARRIIDARSSRRTSQAHRAHLRLRRPFGAGRRVRNA